MDTNDAVELVLLRNAFYRRLYYLVLGAFALSLILIGILAYVLVFVIKNPSEPLYFAADEVSKLLPIIPVNQPNMANEEVTKWAIEAVQTAFSYDYVNYRSQLQNAEKYFTHYGWSNYMNAVTANNNLVAITQRKMIALAKVVEQPKIVSQGLLGGALAWRFTMPVLVTYLQPPYDAKSRFANALEVTVVVQRQPPLQGYKGLGILQIIGSMPTTTVSQPEEISNVPTE